jgi:hypothetical protein
MVYPIVKFGDPVLERKRRVTEFNTPELISSWTICSNRYAAKEWVWLRRSRLFPEDRRG